MAFNTCHGDQSDNSDIIENRKIRRHNPVKEAFTSTPKVNNNVEDYTREADSAAKPGFTPTLRSLTSLKQKMTVLVHKYKWNRGF